ncbi:MAG: aldehyde dehydrogenase family protein [Pseudomonadota bacterium]
MLDQATIDALRIEDVPPQKLFIDGTWVAAQTGKTKDVTSPIDGSTITTIASGMAEDVDRAVAAARAAFAGGAWSKAEPRFRKQVLHTVADLIASRAAELAVLGTRDNGTEIQTSIMAEPGTASATFRHSAECVDKLYGEIAPTGPQVLGMIQRAPVGVVGVIVPWNAPLMITAWKVSAALAVGNSVVLKPAEDASLAVLKLAELCAEAGLPDGVLNVVTGSGSVVGEALSRHMDVDVLAFTGSGAVGRQLLKASAESNMKRVYLELGGKSPNVVFADAPDLDKAAMISAKAFFKNAGQICVTPSRLLVEDAIHDEFLAKVVEHARALTISDPLDLNTQMGAITNANQMETVASFVESAEADGGDLLTGGNAIHQNTGGNYYAPTVVGRVSPEARLFQEEVFGPVLAASPFKSESEALRLANGTVYGLAACVWTSDLSRAHRMINGIDAGMVQVNSFGPIDNVAPMGGVKQSGNGVDKSLHAFDKYLNYKTAWVYL